MDELSVLTGAKATQRSLQLSTLLMVISDSELEEHEKQNLISLAYDISCELSTFMLETDNAGGCHE